MKIELALPGEKLSDEYFEVRYLILRKPLGSPRGSERIAGDEQALHAWAVENNKIVAVGRAHLIADNEDGSVVDAKAKSACPAFSPLKAERDLSTDDKGNSFPIICRPAIQIRQMGVLTEKRGLGIASSILQALEARSADLWHANTGWLQARMEAVPFYEANNWVCFDDEYHIPNVGPHRSMWKNFAN